MTDQAFTGELVDADGDGYPDTAHTGEVIDAEFVAEPGAALTRREPITVSWRRLPSQAAELVRASPHPKTAGLALVRHGAYALGGVGIVVKRLVDATTNSRYERAMRAAETRGDWDKVAEWDDRSERAKEKRHRRRMDWLDVPAKLAKALAIACGAVIVLLFALGCVIAIASGDAGQVLAPIAALFDLVRWVTVAVTVAWSPFVLAAPWVAVVAFWYIGRKAEAAPEWTKPTTSARPGEVVNLTPSIVVAALRDLGIRPLRDAIKKDPEMGARMLGMITQYGPGAQVEIALPPQVTVSDIIRVGEKLAGNLDRKRHELSIECSPDSERVFTLWVANSGALDQHVPPSPLLDEDFGPVDIYRDLMPWGIGLKGDPIELYLLQQHFLLCGLSKQGKTAAARALILWFALDPSTRIWLSDLKGFGDWSMFTALAETLIEGAGAENFIATCDMLEAAVREMQRRYDKWRAMGRKGDIGRADSQPGSGFEPLIVIIDEVQKLYTCTTEHPDGGDIGGKGKKARAARAAQALHDQARAVNIHLFQFAQNPTDQNLPAIIREGAMIRASLFVGTESIAKMALGEAAVDTGAAPHALRMGLDRGTVVLAPGESMDLPGGSTHTTIRTHYISTQDAYVVAERAKALRTQRPADQPEKRDLLADVLEVAGEEEAPRTADVARRLRQLAATYGPYKELTGEALEEWLEGLGVKRGSKNGFPLVRTQRVRHALAEREVIDDGA